MDNALLQKRVQEVLEELDLMLGKTELAASRCADHPTLAATADYLTQIRVQLTELSKAGAGRTSGQSAALAELNARYFRLEGRVKEIRNDTELPDTRLCGRADVKNVKSRRPLRNR